MRCDGEETERGKRDRAGEQDLQHGRRSRARDCAAVVDQLVRLADATLNDMRDPTRLLPSGRLRSPADPALTTGPRPGAQLTRALRELEPEMALKLRTLMLAGRDGKPLGKVDIKLNLSDSEATFASVAADSSENGPLLSEYLRRGHAIACACGIDLNAPLEHWEPRARRNLVERAWLSFGKQLATSSSSEWHCVMFREPSTSRIGTLYLRRGERAWWSFHASLDRPSLGAAASERRALARRSKPSSATTLEGLVERLEQVRGAALERAARAIRARLGYRARDAAAVAGASADR